MRQNLKMSRSSTKFSESYLQSLAVCDSALGEQLMNGRVSGDERQSIGEFKSSTLVNRAVRANPGSADCRFMHQLHGQSGFHSFGWLSRPPTKQVPRSQSQMFGDQKPDTSQIARDLISEKLTHAALNTERIARQRLRTLSTGTCFQGPGWFRTRAALIEFFFEARSRQSLVRRCVC